MINPNTKTGFIIEPQPKARIPAPKPKALGTWLQELPITNSQRCFNALDNVLEAFNSDNKLDAATRLELADQIRPTLCLLAQRAEPHFMDAPLPYPAEAAFHANWTLRLHHRMGIAYALAGVDPSYKPGWFDRSERHFTKALYRALQHWGLVLLRSAQQYRMPPTDYWSMLYWLLRSAEIRKVLTSEFADPTEPAPCRTALGLFKRTLLFNLASIRHLRQRDMVHVYELLGNLVDHVALSSETIRDGESAEFFIRLDEDQPPTTNPKRKHQDLTNLRFLFTGELTRELSKLALIKSAEIHADIGAKEKSHIDKSALLRMARNLEGIQQRKGERRSQDGTCHCVVGLNRLIGLLFSDSPEKSPPPKAGLVDRLLESHLELSPEDREKMLPEEKYLEPEYGDPNLRSELTLPKFLKKKALEREDIWKSEEEDTIAPVAGSDLVETKIANASSHGYCLVWPGDQMAEIRVGELIGIVNEQSTLFTGVVRWLDCGKEQVMLGLEQLTTTAKPAILMDRAMKPLTKGLFLPPEPGRRPGPELLALPGKIHVGNLAYVGDESNGTHYRVHRLHEGTDSYSRFGLVEA